jgi:hypothetical protein
MYLKMIDRFNEWNVSAFVAPSGGCSMWYGVGWSEADLSPFLASFFFPNSSCLLNPTRTTTPTVKLIILHDIKNDEGIRLFFMDVWDHYVKVSFTLLPSPSLAILSLPTGLIF